MPSLLEAVHPRLPTMSKLKRRATARPAADRAITRRYLAVLGTAVLCYAALGAVLAILPDYVHSLGGGAVMVGFAVGAPAVTGAACRPAGGRLADRLGPARIMIAGALVMVVGTIPASSRHFRRSWSAGSWSARGRR